MNRIARALTLAAATTVVLTGCTTEEVANPGGAVDPTVIKQGNTIQVTADASRVATTIDGGRTADGFPATAPQVALTGENTLLAYQATPAGYTFCVVEPTSGAWAYYDSAQGGVTGSGDSGQTCAPSAG